MAVIKIRSNPYDKTVAFQILKEKTAEWKNIDAINNKDSKLISEDILHGFFPFKANAILDAIIDEYRTGDEIIRLEFEGTSDEYDELKTIIRDYDHLELERSDIGYLNATEVMPFIKEIFEEINSIIADNLEGTASSIELHASIDKFRDASSDVIPICVVGNYSSGKSTLINAMIGMELLPSGTDPITSSVFRIKESPNEEASITFEYKGDRIEIDFAEHDTAVRFDTPSEFTYKLEANLKEVNESSISKRMNRCLNLLQESNDGILELIDVAVPFAEGILKNSDSPYYIFDTPGSNAVSNEKHLEVLMDAMHNLSNGLVLYVAVNTALDAKDNKELFDAIKNSANIDDRFTMLIINKADSADLEGNSLEAGREEGKRKLDYIKEYNASGIYYVSSIMGLGAKTGGVFFRENLEEVFEDNEQKYLNKEHKRYKELYRFNNVSASVKKDIDAAVSKTDNLIYANSGLLAIEYEIKKYAEKYSLYNKCNQAAGFIQEVIEEAENQIEQISTEEKSLRCSLKKELDKEKADLIRVVKDKSINMKKEAESDYEETIEKARGNEILMYSKEVLDHYYESALKKQCVVLDVEQEKNEFKEARRELFRDAKKLVGIPKPSKFKEIGRDVKQLFSEGADVVSISAETKKAAQKSLIQFINRDYQNRVKRADENIDLASRGFWNKMVKDVREELVSIVNDTNSLEDEKRKELVDLIISFRDIVFSVDHRFRIYDFEKKLNIGPFTIDLNALNTKKLAEDYNEHYRKELWDICKITGVEHAKLFETWRGQLIDLIMTNIVDYSPLLTEKALRIREHEQKIEKLQNAIEQLEGYSSEIVKLKKPINLQQ